MLIKMTIGKIFFLYYYYFSVVEIFFLLSTIQLLYINKMQILRWITKVLKILFVNNNNKNKKNCKHYNILFY